MAVVRIKFNEYYNDKSPGIRTLLRSLISLVLISL